ncbi:MAG: hypothetical protein K2X57_29160 [Xanthobacteraceae bacterium]|nr:hypothetical protein [Xanthobacteraceae bacterium]
MVEFDVPDDKIGNLPTAVLRRNADRHRPEVEPADAIDLNPEDAGLTMWKIIISYIVPYSNFLAFNLFRNARSGA